ncbi:unnamed protein product [Mesocestoides corti]|nr:unnamed protein product [Mesocestoides corti]
MRSSVVLKCCCQGYRGRVVFRGKRVDNSRARQFCVSNAEQNQTPNTPSFTLDWGDSVFKFKKVSRREPELVGSKHTSKPSSSGKSSDSGETARVLARFSAPTTSTTTGQTSTSQPLSTWWGGLMTTVSTPARLVIPLTGQVRAPLRLLRCHSITTTTLTLDNTGVVVVSLNKINPNQSR